MSAARVRYVTGEGARDDDGQALVVLASALAAAPDVDLDVLVWLEAPRSHELAALAPSLDAAGIDRSPLPRALQLARQPRIAQAVKTPRLRRLLSGLPDVDVVVLADLSVVPHLAWVPTPPALAVQVADRDTSRPNAGEERTAAALLAADVVVVTGESAESWVLGRGVDPERVARHALLDRDAQPAPSGPDDLEVVGIANVGGDEVADVIVDIVRALPTRPLAFRWYGTPDGDWSLWQRADGIITHRVEAVDAGALAADLADLVAVVHPAAAPLGEALERRARLVGVPVVAHRAGTPIGPALGTVLDGGRTPSGWTLTGTEAVADLRRRLGWAGDAGHPGAAPEAPPTRR